MKFNNIILFVPLLLLACSNSDDANGEFISANVIPPVIKITENLTAGLSTDKALYKPGESVHFFADGTLPSGSRIRYRKGIEVVSDDPLVGNSWSWTAPETDYTGYVVDLYTKDGNSSETIYATVGVDVSSDWTKFPRYGFVATYTADKTPAVVSNEMAFLNRCHINGVQFYDWHNKHHWPLGGTRDNLLETYKDIANRTNVTSVIKNYISVQHSYGMKSMFYNLCYGALKDAAQDGVSDTWYSFKDESHNKKYVLTLSSSWKSNIYLMDPANADWQNYIAQRNDDVYANFDFDGYHVDQIGDLGTLYDYYGSKLNMPAGYASFLRAMKTKHPNKSLVMNAVSNYGAENIASTGDVDFMYTEVWGGESKFSSLHSIIKANDAYSNNTKNTVFAAYMDYGYNGTQFNDPGVLLTDAVIFSLGGDHLELGDHMLCHEYFANNHLEMSDHLKSAIVKYYDFLTAYQNLLRGGGYDITSDLASGNVSVAISSWPPKLQTVTAYSKMVNHTQVIHLLNFRQANSLSWRDMNADMPEPEQIDNLTLRLKADGVKKIWVASPDTLGGAPQELSFNQNGGYVEFTVPSLKYWTMIVVEK